jgi:DNA-binding winged helix-turn-helix (wHTH) protein
MGRPENRYYEFGRFRMDLQSRVLMRSADIVPITPKAFDTLLALVERRGELVGRQELIKAVWPDSFVVEGNLNSNIFMLRKALGAGEREGETYIATVPRRGYRFAADVREVCEAKSSVMAQVADRWRYCRSSCSTRSRAEPGSDWVWPTP